MRIQAAAIVHDGRTWVGHRHHLIIRKIVQELGLKVTPIKGDQGFVTDDGRFVDRHEAARIAFKAGQTKHQVRSLFSEDIFRSEEDVAPAPAPKKYHRGKTFKRR